MTCKDCLYEPKCISHIQWMMGKDWNNRYTPDMEVRCKSFKNKADVVEVVRCKDCKNYRSCRHRNCCTSHMIFVQENDFCSYGMKKEGAEE